MTLCLFEQGVPHFHCVLGPAHYEAECAHRLTPWCCFSGDFLSTLVLFQPGEAEERAWGRGLGGLLRYCQLGSDFPGAHNPPRGSSEAP